MEDKENQDLNEALRDAFKPVPPLEGDFKPVYMDQGTVPTERMNHERKNIKTEQQDIHTWFGLSYAQYLTIPRSVLQSMPEEWQYKFIELLNELDETIDWRPKSGIYWVKLKNDKGQYINDPLMDYERGRRKIVHK